MSTLNPSLRGAIAVPGWAKNELWRRARALPSLDLRFAENKSLVDARTGSSLVTFTRASTGTYVGSDGLIKTAAVNEARFDHNPTTGESLGLLVEEQRTNLLTWSEGFDNATWPTTGTGLLAFGSGSIVNAITSPAGTLTADLFTEDAANSSHYIGTPVIPWAANTTYTISLFVKANGRTRVDFFGVGGTNFTGGRNVGFNLSTGTIIYNDGAIGSIASYPNGWYRISMTMTAAASPPGGQVFIRFLDNSNNFTYTGDGTSGIYLWGAQLEAGAFPTSYIPTLPTFVSRASTATFFDANGVIQTAGIDVARSNAFLPDSNGVMRPIGLLAEEQRTNLLTWSEQFDNASWGKTLSTVTSNAATAPDGFATADKLIGNSTLDAHYVQQNSSGFTSGISYTSSVYAKASEITRIEILHVVGDILYAQGYDLSNGTLLTRVTPGTTAATGGFIQPVGNGWYRCGITQTSNGTAAAMRISLRSADTLSFNATSQGVLLWGAQLEAGAFPTSYIPTLPSFVSRASTATFFDSNGILQTAAVNTARSNAFLPDSSGVMRSIGLLVEEARTNSIRNNTMVGAVAGTPGTLPTNWPYGVAATGLTRQVVGTGIENGVNYIDIKISGTSGSTLALALAVDRASALTGQSWTGSAYVKLVAGSTAGITAWDIVLIEETSAFVGVSSGSYSMGVPSSTLTRVSGTRTLSGGATVASLLMRIDVACTNGATIDITLRIGLPQLEQGAFATSVIPTSGTATTRSADVTNIAAVTRSADVTNIATATRSADVASISGNNYSSWANANEGTLYADVTGYMNDALTGQRTVASISDGTYSNNFGISKSSAGNTWRADGFSGGGGAQAAFTGPYAAGVPSRIVFGYALNNANASFNGSVNATDTSVNPPVSPNRLDFRDPTGASIGHPTVTIKRLTYWPARLANSILQSITA